MTMLGLRFFIIICGSVYFSVYSTDVLFELMLDDWWVMVLFFVFISFVLLELAVFDESTELSGAVKKPVILLLISLNKLMKNWPILDNIPFLFF